MGNTMATKVISKLRQFLELRFFQKPAPDHKIGSDSSQGHPGQLIYTQISCSAKIDNAHLISFIFMIFFYIKFHKFYARRLQI